MEWGRIQGGIGRVISEKSPTLGEITDTGVIRYRWKAAHLEAVREYREQERRDKEDMAIVQAARRRVRADLRKGK